MLIMRSLCGGCLFYACAKTLQKTCEKDDRSRTVFAATL